ncbi:tRNA methyltransferase Trm12 [Schizosaccharomyces japonicus yFS275]|uniref:tRNA wybutosine-synthesizing protein 2 n=1 Tax=Schizosaccharomyces japonicus (strain yFS275 / FY16936) TaxID=402676 RepID=B6K7L9_SCHJY|nr:tRNA methyltransferase Trm12 [Schizosaccharomyces japonicus yFS275]EEB09523.1 tRNA methyltransferase Trm12 [Schizosaccharomyces japonicus yFS275]
MSSLNNGRIVCLLAPKREAKKWKNILEENKQFYKQIGIKNAKDRLSEDEVSVQGNFSDYILLPTLFHKIEDINISSLLKDDSVQWVTVSLNKVDFVHKQSLQDRVLQFVRSVLEKGEITASAYPIPSRFCVYGPMALLSSNSFSTKEWKQFFEEQKGKETLTNLYKILCEEWKTTHLAINDLIPTDDIMRRPCNLRPLFGNFGELVLKWPTQQDFDNAFWVHCRQNGIYQCWAPRYTMFSRGNIVEKARLLSQPCIQGEFIADLYVGIGYFAFSYIHAGAKTVFGWEINPWSVEGLRRAAIQNGWTVCIVQHDEEYIHSPGTHQLVVFLESNEFAESRLRKMNVNARHVNLGLLPTSKDSWKTAAHILSPTPKSTIHVHENVASNEIVELQNHLIETFSQFLELKHLSCSIHPVKQFSPHVEHVVFDVVIQQNN